MKERIALWVAGVLLLYVLGMIALVPLGPGLIALEPVSGSVSPLRYEVVGLGTHFAGQTQQARVFAGRPGEVWEWRVIEARNDARLVVEAVWPEKLKTKSLDLFVYHPTDGTLLLENALHVGHVPIDDAAAYPPLASPVPAGDNLGFHFPFQPQIFESIRNLMLHVPMWFAMFFLSGLGFFASVRQLGSARLLPADGEAHSASSVALFFGILGLLTGSIWARFTWGTWWVDDPQLNGALVTVLVYGGYHVLRASLDEPMLRARLSSVYNLFAFVILIVLLLILPRFSESLHPGKGGNPGFNTYDLDSALRWVFYPAVVGWSLLGWLLYRIHFRYHRLRQRLEMSESHPSTALNPPTGTPWR